MAQNPATQGTHSFGISGFPGRTSPTGFAPRREASRGASTKDCTPRLDSEAGGDGPGHFIASTQ